MADQENLMLPGKRLPRRPPLASGRRPSGLSPTVVASLREQTAKLCDEMLESIKTCETGVHQKTLNRLVKVHRSV